VTLKVGDNSGEKWGIGTIIMDEAGKMPGHCGKKQFAVITKP
jgi:hypothetical protein